MAFNNMPTLGSNIQVEKHSMALADFIRSIFRCMSIEVRHVHFFIGIKV